MISRVVEAGYMSYLKEIEEGLYDKNEVLIENKLRSLKGLPLPPLIENRVDMKSYRGLALLGVMPGIIRAALARFRGNIQTPDLSWNRGAALSRS